MTLVVEASMEDAQPAAPARIRVADWLMQALVDAGFRHAFAVPGGGAMHLDDAAGACAELDVVFTLHEQAAAIAAETYTKVSGQMALCLVTTGPGGTNAITGVAGAWLDSTPMLVISGQAKRDDLIGNTGVRQRGVQEVDIVSLVGPITKEAVLVVEPTSIRYALERALHVASTGRPGPVWLDIPLDVQAAPIDPTSLVGFDPAELAEGPELAIGELREAATSVLTALAQARRPLVLLGAGVRLAGAEAAVRHLVETLQIPVLSSWPAQGIIGDDSDLFVGRPGPLAARGPNFALQNADVLLCLGARLDLVTTGYDPADFGRRAHKIVVDIDPAELGKLAGAVAQPVCADVGAFTRELLTQLAAEGARKPTTTAAWRDQCLAWRTAYPVVSAEHRAAAERFSTFALADALSDLIEPTDVVATGSSGLGIEIFLLALRVHTGQRVVYTTALGAMGYGPPAAIGACLAAGGRRTISVDGDGGFQLNVQELETMRRLDLPIKMFVLSNDGYASIRASQQRWFGRLAGADATSGLTLPPLEAIAAAYGLTYRRLDPNGDLSSQLAAVLATPGPVICDVPTPRSEAREPAQTSEALPDGGFRSRPIEDLAPLLPRAELAANLLPVLPRRGGS
ncbi:MAG: acetolactate synthase large subunit [Frankiaceae bacterium]|nr:acetolactate synthase large subunit [Frankiaceae bacterium]